MQQAGLRVFDAQSAEEAMEKLTQYQPHLIVLDVVMEGKSGFEMCRTLKADTKTKFSNGRPKIIIHYFQ